MRKFPLFIDISDWNVIVIGAGRIGARRIDALLSFGCAVTVIAPAAERVVKAWAGEGRLRWLAREYREGDLENARMALAATQYAIVNDQVEKEARERNLLFNRCDKKEACDFHFPGLVIQDDLVIGINSGGKDHRQTAEICAKIRRQLERV